MRSVRVREKITLILFGIFLCMVLLEIGLRIGGSIILSLQEHRNRIDIKEKGLYKIMCVGGSTTAIQGGISYPTQLEEILNERDVGIRFKVINKGVSGANSTFVLSKLKDNLNKYNPDMVIPMIGLNDCVFRPILYEESLRIKTIMFVKGFRVHKLIRILWLNIVNKTMELQKDEEVIEGERAMLRNLNSSKVEVLKNRHLIYMMQSRLKEAEKVLKKALEIEPNSSDLYCWLGESYVGTGRFKEAEKALKKARGLCQGSESSYSLMLLGDCYRKQQKYQEAESVLKKAVKLDPMYRELYSQLVDCYKEQGKSEELQELSENIKNLKHKNDYFYGFLGTYYSSLGRNKEAENYYIKANKYRSQYYNPTTRQNYQKLRDIVKQKGIKLVCVQYPVRSVEPLKKLFDSTEGIIFVDNEKIFKEALEKASYDEYFEDSYGGDFGHCTKKGNRLLAENIANVILRECFNR